MSYYLGLLLKYLEQDKVKKYKSLDESSFSGVWLPKVKRKFDNIKL